MNSDPPDGANPLVPAPADPIDPRHRPVVFYVPPRRVSPLRRAPGLAATTGSCLLIVPMLVIALANPSTSSSIAGTTLQRELVVPATGSEDPPATIPPSTAVPLPQRPAAPAVPSAGHPPSVTVGTRLVAAAELSVVGSGRSAAVGTRTTSTATTSTTVTPAKTTPAKITPAKITPTTPSPQAPVPAPDPSPAPTPACPSSAGGVITAASGSTEGPVATIQGMTGSSTGSDSTPLAVPTETSTPK